MTKLLSNIFSILKRYGPKYILLRKLFRTILKLLYPNGIFIKLGNKYPVKVIPDFIDYVYFGGEHNIANKHCIDSLNGDETFIDIGVPEDYKLSEKLLSMYF